MISGLSIENFKSHPKTELRLSNINLLTGLNGMGKSSIIQSLLLLRQSHLKGLLMQGLELNGELCSIGVGKDAIYQFAQTDSITFKIHTAEQALSWVFDSGPSFIQKTFLKAQSSVDATDLSLFGKKFQYISAYRNGPAGDYPMDTSSVELGHQISRKEGRCELVAHFLHYFAEQRVPKTLAWAGQSLDLSLRVQTEAWMSAISPSLNIHIHPGDTDFKIAFSFNRGKGATKTNEYRASNVGFGVSYVLPIVAAALQAPKGSLVLVENPESHIHPAGQAVLMELIAKAANEGVQFIIETHSDHIINGLLVATKKGFIRHDASTVHFLDRKEHEHATTAHAMDVLPGGKIKSPPAGFFDQFDKDMKTLIGF